MEAKPNQNSKLNLTELLKKVEINKVEAEQENEILKNLMEKQNTLIQRQRQTLLKVAELSSQLAEIEKQKKTIQSQLQSERTQLLLIASQSKQLNTEIEQALADADIPTTDSNTSTTVLHSIEQIQRSLYSVTENALQKEDLQVTPEEARQLVSDVNDVIEDAIKTGAIKEDAEDTIRRQGFIINSLISDSN